MNERPNEVLLTLRSKAAALPLKPGVYIMENKNGDVIYVGKSRALRNRVSQYFHGSHDVKTEKMASNVYDFRFIVCNTEIEALALENQLIKQYTPRYNIRLKDAKSYPYIKITNEEYPKIIMTRNRKEDGGKYFGPYSTTSTVYSVIDSINKSLRIPNCKYSFPKDIGKIRPCVYKQIGRCIGVCDGSVTQEEYKSVIKDAENILTGNISTTIESLTSRMYKASENMEFENAARYRDAITALHHLGEKQQVVGKVDFECDVISISMDDNYNCASIFYVRNGYITDTEHFVFGEDEILTVDSRADVKIVGDDEYLQCNDESPFVNFIIGLYKQREYIPHDIYLSFPLCEEDIMLVSEYLKVRAGKNIKIRTPIKGNAKKLCQMAIEDAKQHAENLRRDEDKNERLLVKIANMLKLEVLPTRIEAYDVSNLGNEFITAGMIVVENTKFKKSDYRWFKIESTSVQDDYLSMKETLYRRFMHLNDESGSFASMPDLILLDGGEGHLNVVRELLNDLKIDLPVFGMVKDSHHKTRTLIGVDGEVSIAKDQEVFRFIYGIQEEIHRFTITRMKNSKRKTLKRSSLENISGIGPQKAKLLLKHFGTIQKLSNASKDDILKISLISEKEAQNVVDYFKNKKGDRK